MTAFTPTAFAETADRITADELRRRGGMKWTRGGPGVLGAFVAEMDFGTAPAVEAALRDVIERKDYGYLSEQAVAGMSRACADWQRTAYGWDMDPARIRPLPDVIKGLEAAITLFSRPGSPVILPTPAYMPFLTVPGRLGRDIIQVPMLAGGTVAGGTVGGDAVGGDAVAGGGGRLVLDLDALDAAFRAGGHLLILCNPCNPVGRVYSRDELAAVASVVERHGGRVFADEIHAPLVYPGGRHIPYASISAEAAAHTVTATSASKGWNLPGLKCAQLILTNDADAEAWARNGSGYEHGASTPGVRANTAAYADGGGWLADVIGYLDGNRRMLAELLADHLPAVRYTPPEGTYLAWLDCRELGLDPSPAEFFLAGARVLATEGAACGEAGRGHLRLNFATPRPVLAEIVRRMGAAVVG